MNSWVIAGAITPGYSAWRQGISELVARHSPHAWIVTAGLVVLGLSCAALAPGLILVLPGRRATRVAALALGLAGLALVLTAAFPLDCELSHHACRARFDAGGLSWKTSAHVWLSLVASVALLVTPFAIARALWPRPVGAAALGAGAVGLALAVAGEIANVLTAPVGISQRLELLAGQLWVLLVARGILYGTRAGLKTAPLTPVRSREMFAASWTGEGAFSAWPPLVGRFIRARFRLSRTTTFLSEEIWMFDDVAEFPGGTVLTQRLICTLEPTGRIHVTSDVVPGGCEVLLEERGYRLTPYRYLIELGPLKLTLRYREEHRLQPDGSLRSTIKARWLGLPVGTTTWHAWRTDHRDGDPVPDGSTRHAVPGGR
jgi:hypothetical membrane protein